MIDFVKKDSRIIKIEPNPFKVPKLKFKMKVKRMQGGRPVVNSNGTVLYKDDEVPNLHMTPGTYKTLSQVRTARGIETGLNEIVNNPYKDEKLFDVEWADRVLQNKERVRLQYLLEYEHGMPYNYYTSNIPEGAIPSNKEGKRFFEKAESRVRLSSNTTILRMDNPIHQVQYYMLLNHPKIAVSFADLEEGLNQEAEWYIVDEEEKERYRMSKIERETRAAAALEDLKSSNSEAIQQMAKALELDQANDRNLSKSKAARIVYEFYNKGQTEWKRYLDYYALWKDAARRNHFVTAAELFDYIKAGVVSYRNGKYTWTKRGSEGKPSEVFARSSKSDMINNFLLDVAYQDEVEMLQEEYTMKTR